MISKIDPQFSYFNYGQRSGQYLVAIAQQRDHHAIVIGIGGPIGDNGVASGDINNLANDILIATLANIYGRLDNRGIGQFGFPEGK